MAVREVTLLGNPVLRKRATEVAEVTEEMKQLIADMFETMYAEEGVGLAGPQVGESVRVIVVDPHEDGFEPFALINPRIVEFSDETARAEEGCLSIPGLREVVERSTAITGEGLDRDGKPVRMESEGFVARILQHEVDHIDGILFLD